MTRTTIPHSPADEAALLGAALLNAAAANLVATQTSPADFHVPAHQRIRDVIASLVADNVPVDCSTVASHIARSNGAAPILRRDLHQIEAACPASSNAAAYLVAVRDWGRRRRLLGLAAQLRDIAAVGGPVDGVLAQIEGLDQEQVVDASTWRAATGIPEALAGKAADLEPACLTRDDGLCLLYPGKTHLFAGEPESGKSWLMLHACVEQISLGRHAWYIDFEDDLVTTVSRLLTLSADPTHIVSRFHYIRPTEPLTRTAWGIVAAALKATSPSLVIIDGLTEALTVHGFELNSNRDVAAFYELVPRPIARHGPAVAIIDHVAKASEQRGRWSIGAQHKLGGIDGASYSLEVAKPVVRGRDGLVRVVVNKDRPGYVRRATTGKVVAEMRTTSDDHTLTVELAATNRADPHHPDGTVFRPTGLMERISRWLEMNPDATGRAARQAVRGKEAWKVEALRALTVDGHAVATDGHRGALSYRIVKPFRESQSAPGQDRQIDLPEEVQL